MAYFRWAVPIRGYLVDRVFRGKKMARCETEQKMAALRATDCFLLLGISLLPVGRERLFSPSYGATAAIVGNRFDRFDRSERPLLARQTDKCYGHYNGVLYLVFILQNRMA